MTDAELFKKRFEKYAAVDRKADDIADILPTGIAIYVPSAERESIERIKDGIKNEMINRGEFPHYGLTSPEQNRARPGVTYT